MDLFEFVSANLMLPLGGLLIALFAGWFMSEPSSRDELELPAPLYGAWRFLARFVAPIAVAIVLLNAIGLI
jgi:NSS family neurotransmitter:Na+ symporter